MAEHTTNGNTSTTVATAVKKAITQKGLRMPNATLSDVRDLVMAMDALNGPASRAMIFDHAGKGATGGVADQRWAALGYYGLRRKAGPGKEEITDRGRALLSDDPGVALEARQHAVMATGFRSIIERFTTRQANEETLAAVLTDSYSVPGPAAKRYASVLVEVATEAELISDGKFRPGPIEAAAAAVPTTPQPAAQEPTRKRPTPSPVSPTIARTDPPGPKRTPLTPQIPEEGHDPAPLGLRVEIKIEADKHTPQEIGQILREVQRALHAEPA